MTPQPIKHVSYGITIHDVYTSRSLDHLRKFLSHHTPKRTNLDRHGGYSITTSSSNGFNSILSHRLSKSPSNGASLLNSHSTQFTSPANLNRKDIHGRTVLHRLAATDDEDEALSWLQVLGAYPQLQVDLTDSENGWTALHRALFHGNLRVSRVLILDLGAALDITDHEGLTPFALYSSTIDGASPIPPALMSPLTSQRNQTEILTWGHNRNFVLGTEAAGDRVHPERIHLKHTSHSSVKVSTSSPRRADSRPLSSTPVSLVTMGRLHTAIVTTTGELWVCGFGSGGRLGLGQSTHDPVSSKHATAQTQLTFARVQGSLIGQKVTSVALGQDHTVAVTEGGHVYTFGMNRFGQLGYGPDSASCSSEPSQISIASHINPCKETIQAEPKRVVGPLKKERILGATASRWHTAVFTANALYTWGAHQGQLGYNSPSHSTQSMWIQWSPRKVSAVTSPISQLSCTDHVTAYLYITSEVYLLRANSCIKITFPSARFPPHMSVYRPRGKDALSRLGITNIAAFGDTLAAVSSLGDVFALDLDKASQPGAHHATSSHLTIPTAHQGSSTGAFSNVDSQLYRPQRVWTLGKKCTAATNVAVGMDGSIVFCTKSGHVFHSKRSESSQSGVTPANPRSGDHASPKPHRTYKTVRLTHSERIIQVAANSTGAFSACRQDATLKEIRQMSSAELCTLPATLVRLLSHLKHYAGSTPELHTVPLHRDPNKSTTAHEQVRSKVIYDDEEHPSDTTEPDSDEEVEDPSFEWDIRVGCALFCMSLYWDLEQGLESPSHHGDLIIMAENKPILVHQFVICSRSKFLKQIICQKAVHPDIVYHPANSRIVSTGSKTCLTKLPVLEVRNTRLIALLLFVHYLYTDVYPCLWDLRVRRALEQDHQDAIKARIDQSKDPLPAQLQDAQHALKSLAHLADLPALAKSLERTAKAIPEPCLAADFQDQLVIPFAFDNFQDTDHPLKPDVALILKDDQTIRCHSLLMRAQCPFFQMMLEEDAWIFKRRQGVVMGSSNVIRVDMSHFTKRVMDVVIRHIYTDDAAELFLNQGFESLDQYVDFVVDVMAVANEFLMDKLKWICSVALRDCINLNNVTSITAEAEFYKADALKSTCMTYIICNLETMFQDKGLIDIPTELLAHISYHLKRSQERKFPQTRSQTFIQTLMQRNSTFLSELDLPKSKLGLAPRHWKQYLKSLGAATHQPIHSSADSSHNKPILGEGSTKRETTSLSSSPATPFPNQNSGSPASLNVNSLGTTGPKTTQLSRVSPGPQLSRMVVTTSPQRPLDDRDVDEAPFMMDELELPDALECRTVLDDSKSLRGAVWASLRNQRIRTDLRSIMAAEKPPVSANASTVDRIHDPPIQPPSSRTSFESSSSTKLSQREKRKISLETSKLPSESLVPGNRQPAWKPSTTTSARVIELGRDLPATASSSKCPTSSHSIPRRPCASFGAHCPVERQLSHEITEQASKPNAKLVIASGLSLPGRGSGSGSFAPTRSAGASAVTTTLSESIDPASAVGAAVITPTKMPLSSQTTGTSSASRSHKYLGGQDSAWTNYASTSSTSFYTSGLVSNSSLSPEATLRDIGRANLGASPPASSTFTESSIVPKFSMIQSQQQSESLAIKYGGKNKPSLAKIQEEENMRQQERQQEQEFLKWFEEESRKQQQQSVSAAQNPKSLKTGFKKPDGRKSSKGKTTATSNAQYQSGAAESPGGSSKVPHKTPAESRGHAPRNASMTSEARHVTPSEAEQPLHAVSAIRRGKPKPKSDLNQAMDSSSRAKTCPSQVARMNSPHALRGPSQVKSK